VLQHVIHFPTAGGLAGSGGTSRAKTSLELEARVHGSDAEREVRVCHALEAGVFDHSFELLLRRELANTLHQVLHEHKVVRDRSLYFSQHQEVSYLVRRAVVGDLLAQQRDDVEGILQQNAHPSELQAQKPRVTSALTAS